MIERIAELLDYPIFPEVTFSDLMPSDSLLLTTIGYSSLDQVSQEVKNLADDVKRQLCEVGRPQIGVRVYPGHVQDENTIDISGTLLSPGKKITGGYLHSQYFAVVVGSIGRDADHWLQSSALNEDIMIGFLADNLCTLVAERIVFWTQKYLADQVRPFSMKVSASYSPGYCDWQLADQRKLFSLLPENVCGVELNADSLLMLPIKSVSTIIGIGNDVSIKRSGCAICEKTDCYRRKLR